MMRYQVLTLFPEMIDSQVHQSIIGRAIRKGLLSVETINIRDFSEDRNRRVDDYPYGGGAGMVMEAEPVFRAVQAARKNTGKSTRVIYLTPQAEVLNQTKAEELAMEEDLILLCGHYEGIDERVLEECVTDYISIGDYVLTGGELGALVLIDAVSRFVPGVLGNETSSDFESMQDHLLEYPHYTRPEIWHEKKVPEVLLSGDHAKVETWRYEQSVKRTGERRPDLLQSGFHFVTLFVGETAEAAELLSERISRYGECLDYNRRKLQKGPRTASRKDFYVFVIPASGDCAEMIQNAFRNLRGKNTPCICLSVIQGDGDSGTGGLFSSEIVCLSSSEAGGFSETEIQTSESAWNTEFRAGLAAKGFVIYGYGFISKVPDPESLKKLSIQMRKIAEKIAV